MSARKQPKPSNIVEFKRESDPRKGLTFKQVRFCEQYILCEGNKAKAAVRAGYSAKSAIWQASEIYRNPLVQTYIQYLLRDQHDNVSASIAEIKRRMTLGLRGELKEEVVMMETTTTTKKDKKGRNVKITKTKPILVEKRISIRDSIESAKLFGSLYDFNDDLPGDANGKSTDDNLLRALKSRKVNIEVPSDVQFEEDEPDVDGKKPED